MAYSCAVNFEWDESKSEGVFTPRALRIISARKANQREVKQNEDSTPDDESGHPGRAGRGAHRPGAGERDH